MMPFNPKCDKIAITIPKFTLIKGTDGIFDKYNEPYITSIAIDSSGKANPQIDFNFMPFPKVAKGGTVNMLGDGHLVYGPKNPGEFVAVSILVMESDQDMRELGGNIEKTIKSKAVDLGVKAILAANPGHAAIVGILKELTVFIAGVMKENKDDELFRIEGSFLQGHPVPYHINRSYEYKNDYIGLNLNVIPLVNHNTEGPSPTAISL